MSCWCGPCRGSRAACWDFAVHVETPRSACWDFAVRVDVGRVDVPGVSWGIVSIWEARRGTL